MGNIVTVKMDSTVINLLGQPGTTDAEMIAEARRLNEGREVEVVWIIRKPLSGMVTADFYREV